MLLKEQVDSHQVPAQRLTQHSTEEVYEIFTGRPVQTSQVKEAGSNQIPDLCLEPADIKF